MSRTWKREPIRRRRDDYQLFDRSKHVARNAPMPCLIGTIDDTVSDAMMSGDNTFVRRAEHA